jgi:hypothetical protein
VSDWFESEVERLQAKIELLKAQVDVKAAANTKLVLPSVAEFILGPRDLAQRKLYPKQLTVQRVIFCERNLMTAYDLAQIKAWGTGFEKRPYDPAGGAWLYEPAMDRDYVSGTTPDLLERIAENLGQGRRWFREPNVVVGRRGSKGFQGALTGARLVAELLALGDPQDYFEIPVNKRLMIPIIAGNLEQARFNLFADMAGMIIDAPFFAPFVQSITRDRLVIATPADLARPDRPFAGSIEIVASAATSMAVRGPATPFQFYDEMAHVEPGTSKASAEEIYSSSTPAMDQFGTWAMVMELSSPHHQTGEFFEIHCRAREIDPQTGIAAYPEIFTIQEPSWTIYEDYERAHELPLIPEAATIDHPGLTDADGAPATFPPIRVPMSVYDAQMEQLRRANKKRFRIERLAQWGTSIDAIFDPDDVDAMFDPYQGALLTLCLKPALRKDYVLVLDPATKNDPFAWAIGHRDPEDERGRPHAIIDLTRRYVPPEDGVLDVEMIMDQLEADIRLFRAAEVITDQHAGTFVVQNLNRRLYGQSMTARSQVIEWPRTLARNNATVDAFTETPALRQVHCYKEPQLRRELRFIERQGQKIAAPTRGAVQTDDLAWVAMILTERLLGNDESIGDALGALPVGGRPWPAPGGDTPPMHEALSRINRAASYNATQRRIRDM